MDSALVFFKQAISSRDMPVVVPRMSLCSSGLHELGPLNASGRYIENEDRDDHFTACVGRIAEHIAKASLPLDVGATLSLRMSIHGL